jgi:hypothetical protein
LSAGSAKEAGAPHRPFMLYVAGSMALLLAIFVLGSLGHIGLYSDGSYYFLGILADRFYMVASWYRLGATLLTQSFVVLALHLGVTSIKVLAFLQSANLILVPTLCFAASTWLLRRNPLALLANTVAIACCYVPVSFYAVGEFIVLYGLFWLALVLLLFVERRDKAYFRLLIGLGLFMVASYELSLVTGLILAAICASHRAAEQESAARRSWTIALAIFLLGSLYGLIGIVFPRDPANASGFSRALLVMPGNWSLFGLCVVALLAAIAACSKRPVLVALLAALAGLLLVLARLQVPVMTTELHLGDQSQQRAQVFPLLLLASGILLTARYRPFWLGEGLRSWPLLIPLATVFLLYASDIAAWRGFGRDVCREVQRPPGGETAFFAKTRVIRYGWYWTWPVLGVIYRPEGSQRLLLDPHYQGWLPFDTPQTAPDIERYKRASSLCEG